MAILHEVYLMKNCDFNKIMILTPKLEYFIMANIGTKWPQKYGLSSKNT
jgi:hypothetical protein